MIQMYPCRMHCLSYAIVRIGLLATLSFMASNVSAQDLPSDHTEYGVETGYLTKIKNNSPYDYRIVPTQLVWLTEPFYDLWRGNSGMRLLARHRFALLAETISDGPETYYLGLSAAPTLELWLPDQKTALFTAVGGGAGYINSKGVAGGQGQNFTLNFFTQIGIRHQVTKEVALFGTSFFLHHSNRGMTSPNPGIDTEGITLGLIWQAR